MDGKYILGTVGIVCLTAIEVSALLTHTDGQYLSVIVGGISAIMSGIIGYGAGKSKAE